MIPSSFTKALWSTIFMACIITGMERSPSGFVSASKSPNPTPLPQSQSMVFPKPKKDNSLHGSLGGSLIQAFGGIGRSTSSLFLGRSSSSGEVAPVSIPAAAQPASPQPENPQTSLLVSEKKELIYNKPLYTITYHEKRQVVKIAGSCLTQYRVASLKEFKEGNPYLCRPEIVDFINRILEPEGKTIKAFNGSLNGSLSVEKKIVSKQAYSYLQKYKNHPAFNTIVYVALLPDGNRVCVFESDLTEIPK